MSALAPSHEQLVADCEQRARELARALKEALDVHGVPPIVLLPRLLAVLREEGVVPDGGLPNLGGLLG